MFWKICMGSILCRISARKASTDRRSLRTGSYSVTYKKAGSFVATR